MTTRCRRLLFAVTALWMLTSLVAYSVGTLVERRARFDGCELVFIARTLVHACPIGEFRERPPASPTA